MPKIKVVPHEIERRAPSAVPGDNPDYESAHFESLRLADRDPKVYDLGSRTLEFAKGCLLFCGALPGNAVNTELVKQLVRSTGSIGANYI